MRKSNIQQHTALVLILVTLASTACQHQPGAPTASTLSPEYTVTPIPLSGPLADARAEISGLGWYGDYLILLPQYPRRMYKQANGAIFALRRQKLLDYLNGEISGPLVPIPIPMFVGPLEQRIPGFEGYEAIDFYGDQAFLTIEARTKGFMTGFLVTGKIAGDLSELRLDPDTLTQNFPQVQRENSSVEALLIIKELVVTLNEINGAALNPDPHATRFNLSLIGQGPIPSAQLEYRLTDASHANDSGLFWVINYFFPQDKDLKADLDPLRTRYGEGATHRNAETVERLVELQYTPEGITLTATPPIQLQLLGDEAPRNWEGLAWIEGHGFIIATDKFPETILGFVAYP
jgi:hypothetical protein